MAPQTATAAPPASDSASEAGMHPQQQTRAVGPKPKPDCVIGGYQVDWLPRQRKARGVADSMADAVRETLDRHLGKDE